MRHFRDRYVGEITSSHQDGNTDARVIPTSREGGKSCSARNVNTMVIRAPAVFAEEGGS